MKKRPTIILARWLALAVSIGLLIGFWLACAVVNAVIIQGPFVYVGLLVLAALSGAATHKLSQKCR